MGMLARSGASAQPDAAAAPRPARYALSAFGGVGIELEYMIVDRASLDVRPIADALIARLAGEAGASDAERGALGVSNELALHVIELKNLAPASELASLQAPMQSLVREIDAALASFGARLLPGGMHPWMRPRRETELWPHAGAPIYAAYDAIFDCRTHGYANLQAMHVNLPFAGDEEFARLHAAVRLVLPLLPAIAAASPVVEGRPGAALDLRLEAYRDNARRLPQLTGEVIPDTVASRAAYEAAILEPMYRAIAPFDRDGLLQHEWLNSRGAIARFDRDAIEIRLADTQECPAADLAVASLVVGAVRALYDERLSALTQQQALPTTLLARILRATVRDGERALVDDPHYLAAFGAQATCGSAGELWRRLSRFAPPTEPFSAACATILDEGPLARRLLEAIGDDPSHHRLFEVWRALADCLHEGRMFHPSR